MFIQLVGRLIIWGSAIQTKQFQPVSISPNDVAELLVFWLREAVICI